MLIEAIFERAFGESKDKKTFEEYLEERIHVIRDLKTSNNIDKNKTVNLIKHTLDEIFKNFNKKYGIAYINLFVNEEKFNLLINSFNYNTPKLSFEQLKLDDCEYQKNNLKEAIEELLDTFNKEIIILLSKINKSLKEPAKEINNFNSNSG